MRYSSSALNICNPNHRQQKYIAALVSKIDHIQIIIGMPDLKTSLIPKSLRSYFAHCLRDP